MPPPKGLACGSDSGIPASPPCAVLLLPPPRVPMPAVEAKEAEKEEPSWPVAPSPPPPPPPAPARRLALAPAPVAARRLACSRRARQAWRSAVRRVTGRGGQGKERGTRRDGSTKAQQDSPNSASILKGCIFLFLLLPLFPLSCSRLASPPPPVRPCRAYRAAAALCGNELYLALDGGQLRVHVQRRVALGLRDQTDQTARARTSPARAGHARPTHPQETSKGR